MSKPIRGSVCAALSLIALLLLPADLHGQEVVSGTVRDAQSGAVLSGVRISSGTIGTLSDAQGRYRLELSSSAEFVQFARIGYQSLTVPLAQLAEDIHLEASPLMLGAIVVETQGRTKLATGTSLSMTEVDRESIQSGGATSIAESLEGAPGVSISRPGSWGAQAVVRGLSGERVAVMVDGMRVNRACYFGMDDGMATIDPSSVERVEILSGPGSTLYGSGSIGGVINVVSRQPIPGADGVSGELRASASSAIPGGSFGGTLNLQQGPFDLAIMGEGNRFGDYRAPQGTIDGSSLRTGTANVRLGYRPSPEHNFTVQAQVYEGRDIGWPTMGQNHGSGHDEHDEHGSNDHGHNELGNDGHDHLDHEMSIPRESRRSLAADWGWQIGGGILDALTARAYVQTLDHQMYMRMAGNGAVPVTTVTEAESQSMTTGGRVQLRLHSHERLHIDTGVEAVHLSADAARWTESHIVDGGSDREETRGWPNVRILDLGAFAQGEIPIISALTVTGGVRADYVHRTATGWASADEWVGTGNVGLRANLPAGFGTRMTLGYGYRIPDATELFGLATQPDGFVYRGNPELNTETSRNVELSVTYDSDVFAFEVTGFQNDLKDMIAPALASDSVSGRPVREYANLQSARLTGINATAAVQLPAALVLSGTLNHTKGSDRADGTPLPFIPPMEGGVSLRANDVPLTDWVELQFRGAARQDRINHAAGEMVAESYSVLNLHTGFQWGDTGILAGVDNLLDRSFRHHLDPHGLMRPGRNLYVKLTRTF